MPDRSRLVAVFSWLAAVLGAAWSLNEPRPGHAAELSFGPPFGAGMVLQREAPIVVWGRAPADAAVTVSFHDLTATTTADATGRWETRLPARPAVACPGDLVLRSGDNQVVLPDCLIGDVWVCAGQSNMLFPLNKVHHAPREIAVAEHPLLRLLPLLAPPGSESSRPFGTMQIQRLDPPTFLAGQWTTCRPDQAGRLPAVPYFFGAELLQRQMLPIGIICLAVGGTPTEAWIRPEAFTEHPDLDQLVTGDWLRNPLLAGWCQDRARQNLANPLSAGVSVPGDRTGPNHPFKPGFMWRAGVAPLLPLQIRGVVWYQGESNADSASRVEQHAELLPLLVQDWRAHLHQPDLPFAFVQLPGLNRPHWPAFRDAQRRLLAAIPHTGMVVTIDLGDPRDVHPGDKRPIGERLAHWADVSVYRAASDNTAATGPLVNQVTVAGRQSLEISFTETGGRLQTTDGEPPRHFEVAGDDEAFEPASATIVGDRVVLSPMRPTAVEPLRWVRYAWQPYPSPPVNLVNAAGLPASPFRLPVTR